MALDSQLLEILACPDDKGPLFYFESDAVLVCPACSRRYSIADDIPNMLIEDAEVLDDAAVAAFVERARREGIRPTFAA